MKTLILGGVRSGKSRYAEREASAAGEPVTLIATAEARDAEMAQRIDAHRASRPAHWTVLEEPVQLAAALTAAAAPRRTVIVDCLTLWVTQLLEDADTLDAQMRALLGTLPGLPGRIYLVGNETGLGIMPLDPITRRYVDVAGTLHQQLAASCDRVCFLIAGLPQFLKGTP